MALRSGANMPEQEPSQAVDRLLRMVARACADAWDAGRNHARGVDTGEAAIAEHSRTALEEEIKRAFRCDSESA